MLPIPLAFDAFEFQQSEIGLGAADKILLFAVIRCVWLNHETLFEVARPGPKAGAVPVEIDLVGHVIEGPDAMTLAAIESGVRAL